MRLHLLYKSQRNNVATITASLFRSACEAAGVELICYDFAKNAPKFDLVNLPTLTGTDLLYRSTQSSRAVVAERLMINSECATFYKQWEFACFERGTSWYIHNKIGLPVVLTIPYMPTTYVERDRLVEQLGGYPVILKVVGKSLGVGVMRLDSRDSFNSVVDYVHSLGVPALFRKYIDHTHYVRAIVVGDCVIASKAVYASEGEFRTNTADAKKTDSGTGCLASRGPERSCSRCALNWY